MLVLSSCANANGSTKSPEMYIQPATLTEEEKNIIELFSIENKKDIFDFKVNDDCANANGSTKSPEMYIQPATLTEEEKNIIELFSIENKKDIFDFKVNDEIKSININIYKLTDKGWEKQTGSKQTVKSSTGRIALEQNDNKLALILQHKNGISNTSHDIKDLPANIGVGSCKISEKVGITYGKEIPIANYVFDDNNKSDFILNFLDSFDDPSDMQEFTHGQVYIVTVQFMNTDVTA